MTAETSAPMSAAADVPIRPASTVMLLRDTDSGIEVFMLRRTTSAAFAGGMYVFPGGRVDESDGDGDLGYVTAAIRECFEEAGILLARGPDRRTVTDGHPILVHRHAVHGGRHDIRELCRDHGLELAVDDLVWVARWITPKGESSTRRFDTRFYVAQVPPGQTSRHDDTETIASEWVRPVDALRRAAAQELTMMPPTVKSLESLIGHASADDVMRWARTLTTPEAILPRLRRDERGRISGVSLPGDDDYEALPD